MKDMELIHGDCLTVLPTLETGSVHCCITSPPYFGLRDYQTAKWIGGDPACDHDQKRREKDPDSKQASNGGSPRDSVAGNRECRKCGAKRKDQQLGMEASPDAYVANLVAVFREVKRVLRDDGTVWIVIGDSFNAGTTATRKASHHTDVGRHSDESDTGNRRTSVQSLKPKNLIGIPWRVAFALQADGWILRSDIIWHKPNPMPESVRDRPTKSHEYIFLLAKQGRYFYDGAAIKEPAKFPEGSWGKTKKLDCPQYRSFYGEGRKWTGGESRNKRSVWTVATHPLKAAHFATFPPKLITPCVLAGCPEGGTILDPFAGACTTGLVAVQHGRKFIGIDLNPAYLKIGRKRIEESPILQAA